MIYIYIHWVLGQEDPFNKKELPMSIVAEPVDVGDVDYGSFFVSMALEEFRCVVNDMENAAYGKYILFL